MWPCNVNQGKSKMASSVFPSPYILNIAFFLVKGVFDVIAGYKKTRRLV